MAKKSLGADKDKFKKTVALFDSANTGEADNAVDAARGLCTKHGLRFVDAASMAFGGSDSDEVAALQEQVAALQEQLAEQKKDTKDAVDGLEYATQLGLELETDVWELKAALAWIARIERRHVIRNWLRRVWAVAHVRLCLLTLLLTVDLVALPMQYHQERPVPPAVKGGQDKRALPQGGRNGAIRERGNPSPGMKAVEGIDRDALHQGYVLAMVVMFAAWSVAQARRDGVGSMLMKWVVYIGMLRLGGMALHGLDVHTVPAVVLVLLAALVLTLSRLSEWLCDMVRAHVWESVPVWRVRRLF